MSHTSTNSGGSQKPSLSIPGDALTDEQKWNLRRQIIEYSTKLIGVPYEYGACWTEVDEMPDTLDCSELVKGVYVGKTAESF